MYTYRLYRSLLDNDRTSTSYRHRTYSQYYIYSDCHSYYYWSRPTGICTCYLRRRDTTACLQLRC